jgi:hypothetical protein
MYAYAQLISVTSTAGVHLGPVVFETALRVCISSKCGSCKNGETKFAQTIRGRRHPNP